MQSIYTTSNPTPSCLNTTDNCGQLARQPRPGSGQEQERSDHGTAQKSTAVLPLNLKSRKMRSSPSKGEVPPLAFPYIMSFKEDNVTSPGLRSKPGQAAGSVMIHLFPNQSVLDSLGLKRKAVGALQSPPEAAAIVDVKQEN